MGKKKQSGKTEPSKKPSKFYYVIIGGKYEKPKENDGDPQKSETQPILFKTKGLYFILGAIALFFLAPLFVMPSSIGCIPYSYADDFHKLIGWDQYQQLLKLSFFCVLKFISKIFPVVDSETLPKIFEKTSSSAFWAGAIFPMIVGGAIIYLGIGAYKVIKSNIKEYNLLLDNID